MTGGSLGGRLIVTIGSTASVVETVSSRVVVLGSIPGKTIKFSAGGMPVPVRMPTLSEKIRLRRS